MLHPLQIKREAEGLTLEELAELATVSPVTISVIEKGTSPYKTNEGVAQALADALYVNRSELFSPYELSHLGRPPGTGRPIGALRLIKSYEAICKGCNLVFHRAIGCTECDEAAA